MRIMKIMVAMYKIMKIFTRRASMMEICGKRGGGVDISDLDEVDLSREGLTCWSGVRKVTLRFTKGLKCKVSMEAFT